MTGFQCQEWNGLGLCLGVQKYWGLVSVSRLTWLLGWGIDIDFYFRMGFELTYFSGGLEIDLILFEGKKLTSF